MESRSRASPEQFAALLEFMETHGDVTKPQQGLQGRIKADRLWQELVELLNLIGGGVIKSMEKWKKVWADWKTKTKKKALAIRHEASGTGSSTNSRQTLTASEKRVLVIMGLTAVISQAGIKTPPSKRNFQLPLTGDSVHAVGPSQISATGTTASTAPPSLPPPSEEFPRRLPDPLLTPPPGPASLPMPSAMSPTASTSRGAPQRRRRLASPSPSSSTPQRRGLFRVRTRRIQKPFERATSKFVAIELRRLRLEEDREKRDHEREMERLRLESRRIEMEDNRNLILSRLAGAVDDLIQILPQLRPSSLPSPDIIP